MAKQNKGFDLEEELRVKSDDVYSKARVYDKEIMPKIREIKDICARERIPFLTSFAIENDMDKTLYKHDGIFTGSLGMNLADNKFEKFLVVLCDGEVVPKGTHVYLSDDDAKAINDILTSDEFMEMSQYDDDDDEDELSAMFDDVTADMDERAEKAISTKIYGSADNKSPEPEKASDVVDLKNIFNF